MRIAYNPKTAQALMSAPNNEDITFDLSGLAIYVKGVKFEGKAYSVFKKHTQNTTGGYDGLVPAPSYTETTERYLREDGTWVVPNNTTANLADYVTVNTAQTIKGQKGFTRTVKIQVDGGISLHSVSKSEYSGILFVCNKDSDTLTEQNGFFLYKGDSNYYLTDSNWVHEYKILHSGNSSIKDGVITINNTSITPLTSHQSLSNYVTLNGDQTITGRKTFDNSIVMGTSNYIYGINEAGGSMLHFDGERTVIGSSGASSTKSTNIRSNTGNVTINENKTILHTGNSYIKDGVITINGSSITPLTTHQSLSNYVTLNTAQTVTGTKTFTQEIIITNPSDDNKSNYITFRNGTLTDSYYDYRVGIYNDANNVNGFGLGLGDSKGVFTKFLHLAADGQYRATGLISTVPITAPTFIGNLTGTASNADTVGNLHASAFVRNYGVIGANNGGGSWLGYTYITEEHGGATTGGVITAGLNTNYIQLNGSVDRYALYYRYCDDGIVNDWKQIAFTDSDITGNAATATHASTTDKLKTARTLTIGNSAKTFDGSANVSWNLHDILYHGTNNSHIGPNTSWDIFDPGVYYVASTSKFTGTNNPEETNGGLNPYRYGQLIVSRAGDGGIAQFYISHHDSLNNQQYGIKFRTGWKNAYLSTWNSLLDSSNYTVYTVKKDGTGASGDWNINSATTTKLATSRKLWGRDFDGSADVSGDMTGVGVINKVFNVTSTQGIAQLNVSEEQSTINYSHLYVSSNNTAHSNSRPLVLQNGYGNVGIGVIAPTQKLEVSGNVKAQGFIGAGITHNWDDTWSDGSNDNPWHGLKINAKASIHDVVLSGYYGVMLKSQSAFLCVSQTGRVGINTIEPQYKLDVNGTIRANGNILLEPANNGGGNVNGGGIAFWNGANYVGGTINAATLILNNGSTSGNVGIGTITPTQKLEVNGNVKATSFIGNLDWSYITSKPSSFTPSAHIHNELTFTTDTRDQTTTPDDYTNIFKFVGVKKTSSINLENLSQAAYSTLIGWKGYGDSSIKSWELAQTENGRIYIRSGNANWGGWSTIAYATDVYPTNQITALTGYSKATTIAALTATDSLNTALGKLEYKADTAYDLVKGAYDGDGTIENLAEILKVLDGIKDTETIQAIVGKYLPLTGGKLNSGTDTPLVIQGLDHSWISFKNSSGTTLGWIGVLNSNQPSFYSDKSYKIWHEGNDGAGSGLDADLLDGLDSKRFLRSVKRINDQDFNAPNEIDKNGDCYYNTNYVLSADFQQTNAPYAYGMLTSLNSEASGMDFAVNGPLGAPVGLKFRKRWLNAYSEWKQIAFTDSDITGNAAGAYKLISQYVGDLNGAEADRFFKSGFQASNRPSHHNYATGISLYNSELKYKYQLTFDTYGTLYTRYLNSSNTWSAWNQIASISDIPTKLSDLTNDLGFVTGGLYLPLTGGTLTGSLTIGDKNNQDFKFLQLSRLNRGIRINNTSDGAYITFGSLTDGNGLTQEKILTLGDNNLRYSPDTVNYYNVLHAGNSYIKDGVITINGTSITPVTSRGYIGTTAIQASSQLQALSGVSSIFIDTGDPTLKIYSGKIRDGYSDGNICLQTSIDCTDGETHPYATYHSRNVLCLQPRGGKVYIGSVPDGGSHTLNVNGDAYVENDFTVNGIINTSVTNGTWISGMTNAAIKYNSLNALNAHSYHPIIGVKTNGENVVNLGAFVNDVGFYGYKKGRTENNCDWVFKFNSETGAITHTGTSITAVKFIGNLNNTLTFSAGTFSAKTYNNSAAVTVNIPTKTSHLSNDSGFLTQHQSLANYVTLSTAQTITGSKTFTASTNTFSGTGGGILTVDRNSTSPAWVKFCKNGTLQGYIGITNDFQPVFLSGESGASTKTLIHSGNYTNYTVKKDGTGASGTWGIDISGNAATVTCTESSSNYDRPIVVTNKSNGLYYTTKATINYSTGNITASTFTGNLNGSLKVNGIASESEITLGGVRAYSGSGANWTGEVKSMQYAAILTLGSPNRGFQMWCRRGNSSLRYRNGLEDASGWNTERIILDSNNYSSYLGYIGTTAVQASSAAQALTGLTNLTMNGTYTNNNKLVIHSSGCIYPYSTSTRTAGMYGKYDSTKVGHVWSMGTDYKIADDGSSTNNMYGLVYFHTNWSNDKTRNTATRDGSLITEVSNYAGGHQIAFVVNGQVKVALGDRVWSRAGFLKSGSSDSYILLGGGGHKKLSDFLLKSEELTNNLTTITKTLVVSKDWVDTGIVFNAATFPNGTGSYIVQLSRNDEYYWTGYLSIILSRATVNRTDEIILHGGGIDMSGQYYLRTVQDKTTETIKLQIARSSTDTRSLPFTFKFKKLI